MNDSSPQDRLFRMVSGYWISQAIYVAAELRIADRLGDSAMTADELAERTGAHAQSLYRLLRALASVGVFVEDAGHRFRGTPLSDCLKSDAADSQLAAVLMMVGQFYDAWGGLQSSIKSGEPAFKLKNGMSFFDHLTANSAEAEIFDAAMTALNDRKTTAFLDAYGLADVRVLADVGGGNGSALVRILKRYPAMTGILFDLPGVVDRRGPIWSGPAWPTAAGLLVAASSSESRPGPTSTCFVTSFTTGMTTELP